MKVQYVDQESGKSVELEAPNLKQSDLEVLSKSYLSAAQLKNTISNLDVSAEFKLILEKLANFTIKAGEVVVALGKKIFEIVTMFVKKYKHAGFGVILALLVSMLISTIPFFGAMLASFLVPILVVLGFSSGMIEDIKTEHPELSTMIQKSLGLFRAFI